ncbi:MAG: hypothetical protein ACJAZ0_001627 [Halioglobus sp.]|jgi:hypothetical protein
MQQNIQDISVKAYDDSSIIHIVGMYKCGTSWLSQILAAHSAIISWREFDIIRATYAEQHQPAGYRIAAKLAQLLHRPPPQRTRTHFALKNTDEIIRDTFIGRGWIPLMGEQARDEADRLSGAHSGQLIDQLMRLKDQGLRNDNSPALHAENCVRTLGVSNTRRHDLINFLNAVRVPGKAADTPTHFFSYLQQQCEPGTPLVLKAADQVMALHQLQQYSPHSRKLAIIRDGRDAAISAMHYRQLMSKRDAPWALKPRAYFAQLGDWAIRARELAKWADKGDITIVRYEDLHRNFLSVVGTLFDSINLPCSTETLTDIKQATHFSAASGGRAPGQTAQHIARKGTTGEWTTTLNRGDTARAWKIAGAELSRFGYTKSGTYNDGIAGLLSSF